jgi:hypothetical protein
MVMKKNLCIILLLTVAMCVSMGHLYPAYAAPYVGGVWKGTIIKASPTACSSLSLTLTITQCYTSSNVFGGTCAIGTISIPIVGKFRTDGITIDIAGSSLSTATISESTFTAVAVYNVSTGKLTITDLDFTTYDVSGQPSNNAYDNCTLTKQH